MLTADELNKAVEVLTETNPAAVGVIFDLQRRAEKAEKWEAAARRLGYQAGLVAPGPELYRGTALMKILLDWGWTPPLELR